MKKLLFFAAATAVALSSCSKDEVTATAADAQNAISFSTYTTTTTKAVLEDTDFISFEVYAEHTPSGGSPATYLTTTVKRDDSSSAWATDETYYQPTSGSLNFYAYNTLGSGIVTSGLTTSTKTLSFASSTGTDDLVVATADDDDESSTAGEYDLTFSHVLTKVNVGFLPTFDAGVASSDQGNYSFEITSIVISGISTGTYTYSEGFDVPSTGGQDMTFTAPAAFLGTETTSTDATDGDFMLIPGTEATFTVGYKVTYKDVEIADHSTSTKTVTIEALGDAGKNIKYVLQLPVDAIEITFTTQELDGWEDADDITKDVDTEA